MVVFSDYTQEFYMGHLLIPVWPANYCSSAAWRSPRINCMPTMCPSFLYVSCSSSGRTGQCWLRRKEVNRVWLEVEEREWVTVGGVSLAFVGMPSNGQGRHLHLRLAMKYRQRSLKNSGIEDYLFYFPETQSCKTYYRANLDSGEVNGSFSIGFFRTSFWSFLCTCLTIFSLRHIYPQLQVCIGSLYIAKHLKFSHSLCSH